MADPKLGLEEGEICQKTTVEAIGSALGAGPPRFSTELTGKFQFLLLFWPGYKSSPGPYDASCILNSPRSPPLVLFRSHRRAIVVKTETFKPKKMCSFDSWLGATEMVSFRPCVAWRAKRHAAVAQG